MNEHETHSDFSTPDRDVLISRAIDARATPSDWIALGNLARTDSSLWSDLAAAQADAALLNQSVARQVLVAESVELPAIDSGSRGSFWSQRVPRLGWAVAALLALAFVSQYMGKQSSPISNTAGLGVPTFKTADEAMDAYMDVGRRTGEVVGELPQRYILETRPAADGQGYEVLYVRQVLARTKVQDLYRIGADEVGRQMLVPSSSSMPAPVGKPL